MQNNRVAVVGMGGAFPSCSSLDEFRDKIFTNQSLIRSWDKLEPYSKQCRSKVAGFVSLAEMGLGVVTSDHLDSYPEIYLDLKNRIPIENLATADLGSIWAMLGSLQSLAQAQWGEPLVQSERTGVIIGSGGGGHEVLRTAWHNFFEKGKKSRHLGAHNVDRTMVYRDAANVSCLIRNKGCCESIGSACACGLGNIGYATRLIQFGIQDRVIAGGVEGNSIETYLGFDAMQVLSRGFSPEESSRPFDILRRGFVCSFGAGIVALENYEMAKERGAKILAVIDGYYNNSDGDGDMFAPSYDGQQRLWKGLEAISGKPLKPDVVKVHGTSTPAGDGIELFSIVNALGEEGYHISAPKSQFGHMLGAAGAVEFILAVLMLQEQKVSPCLNSNTLNQENEGYQMEKSWLGTKKTISDFRHLLPRETIRKKIDQIVCLNYGFGGTNSAALLSKE